MSYCFKTLTSSQNNDIKLLGRLLSDSCERRRQGVIVLEGVHLAEACVDKAVQMLQVYVNERALQRQDVARLLARLANKVPVSVLTDKLMNRTTALARASEVLTLSRRPLPPVAGGNSTRLLLEGIQDPGNLGAILRCAAAAGVYDVFIAKGCVDAYAPKVLRAGMGAHFALAIHEQVDLLPVLAAFPGKKLVTSLSATTSLYSQDLTGPTAFVFGNEGCGVSAAILAQAAARISIPMPGEAESLNVAMAAAICLFERVRQQQAMKAATDPVFS